MFVGVVVVVSGGCFRMRSVSTDEAIQDAERTPPFYGISYRQDKTVLQQRFFFLFDPTGLGSKQTRLDIIRSTR